MLLRTHANWVLAAIAAVALLLAPAMWNGYPLVFPDTGGYLARTFEGDLELGRSALYGAFLRPGLAFDFWPNVLAQAVMVAWLVYLLLRTHGLAATPLVPLGVLVALAIGTSLPWYAGQLMPDVLVPSTVLGVYLLAFRSDALRGAERIGLGALIAFAMASHMGTLALCAGLAVALIAIAALRLPLPRPRLVTPLAAMLAGLMLAPVSNLAIGGKFAFTPGGESFLFGRLIQDGIIARYLADRCPDPSVQLCRYANTLPPTADDWLWHNETAFYKLGGWRDYAAEERRIIRETLWLYPFQYVVTAARSTLLQLTMFRTEVSTSTAENEHTFQTFDKYTPSGFDKLRAARQHAGWLNVAKLNFLHVPVAALSLAGLIASIAFRRRLGVTPKAAALAATVLATLVINAAVCGVFSNPVDRYQSRLIWLAPLTLIVAAATRNSGGPLSSKTDLT